MSRINPGKKDYLIMNEKLNMNDEEELAELLGKYFEKSQRLTKFVDDAKKIVASYDEQAIGNLNDDIIETRVRS